MQDHIKAAIDEALAERHAHESDALFDPLTDEERAEFPAIVRRYVAAEYGYVMGEINARPPGRVPAPEVARDGAPAVDVAQFHAAGDACGFAMSHIMDALAVIPARNTRGHFTQAGVAASAVATLIGSAGKDLFPADGREDRITHIVKLFEHTLRSTIDNTL